MRKTLSTFAFVVVAIFGLQANAQQVYPWSANAKSGPPANGQTIIQTRNRQIMPPVVGSSAHGILQDSQNGQALQQDKPQDYSFGDQKPVPQGGNDKTGSDPMLQIQSNAISESNGFCEPVIGCPKNLIPSRNGLQIGGWLQTGLHSENTILFNDRQDDFQLHQFWLYADKKTNAHSNFGYRVDAVYGIDGPNLQAVGNPPTGAPSGWDNGWDFGAYGWALPQAYVEYGDGVSTVRAGKFLSPFGCEKLPSVENFFYSRTYTRVLTEPFSHTGLIYEHQRDCNTSYILGATAGWNTGFDTNSGFNVLTGFRKQLNENVSIQSTSSLGDTGPRGSGILNSFLMNARLTSNVNYALQVDNLNLSTNSNDEFGVVQYLMYQKSDFFGLGARLEWWKSDQIFANTKSTWDLTFGANVRPHSNILIRPEIRFDWGAAAIDPGKANFGIDAIVVF